MPGEPTATVEAPTEVKPEVSAATPPDSELEPESILQGVEGEQPPEKEEEAEPEQPEEPEDISKVIDGLPQEMVDAIMERRAAKSPWLEEQLRRKEQSATDRLSAQQARTQAQKEEMDQVLHVGRQAIGEIDKVLTEAERGIEEGTAKLDRPRLLKGIETYRDAYVRGQATTWNRELQEAFVGLEPVAASLVDSDQERLSNAARAMSRTQSRVPLVREMLQIALEKGLELGYGMSHEDIRNYGEKQQVLSSKRDGLEKLRAATPTAGPEGTPAKPTSRQELMHQAALGEDVDMQRLEKELAALE